MRADRISLNRAAAEAFGRVPQGIRLIRHAGQTLLRRAAAGEPGTLDVLPRRGGLSLRLPPETTLFPEATPAHPDYLLEPVRDGLRLAAHLESGSASRHAPVLRVWFRTYWRPVTPASPRRDAALRLLRAPMTRAELARAMGLTPAAAAQHVDRLMSGKRPRLREVVDVARGRRVLLQAGAPLPRGHWEMPGGFAGRAAELVAAWLLMLAAIADPVPLDELPDRTGLPWQLCAALLDELAADGFAAVLEDACGTRVALARVSERRFLHCVLSASSLPASSKPDPGDRLRDGGRAA